MKKKIHNRLIQLDQDLDRLMLELKKYPSHVLSKQPASDAWSPLQIIYHLMLAEHSSLEYVKKKLSYNPKLANAGVGTAIRSLWLRIAFQLPMRFPAPKIVDADTMPENSSLETLEQEWKANRKTLNTYLAELPEDLYGKAIYKHPISGRVSLDGMIRFFQAHFDRHVGQIKRTIDQLVNSSSDIHQT